MAIKQHRHNFPGYEGPASSNEGWWHAESMVHTKYPTAHDQPILGTRDFTPGTRGGKVAKPAAPEYSYNEYGEQVVTTLPEKSAGEQEAEFLAGATAPVLDAQLMVQEAAKHLMETSAKKVK